MSFSLTEYAYYIIQGIIALLVMASQQFHVLHNYLLYLEVFNGSSLVETKKFDDTASIGSSENTSLKSGNTAQAGGSKVQYAEVPALVEQPLTVVKPIQASLGLDTSVRQPAGLEKTNAFDDMMTFALADDNKYLQLHDQIWTSSFNAKIEKILTNVVDVISNKVFFRVDHVVQGGSVRKEVAIAGVTNTEVVFFMQFMPHEGHHKWLPPLLNAAANVLNTNLDKSRLGVEDIQVTEDTVQLRIDGIVIVDLRFSPLFDSYRAVVGALSRQGPKVHPYFRATLVKQRIQFIAKQQENVKVTMRLLKWWRDQQEWSSASCRPSDDLIELLTVHSAIQSKPQDQQVAVTNVLGLMSRFDELTVTWSNFYKKTEIWEPLLNQRPLVMDPVNPFLNVADPQVFDFRELMAHASQTRFFW